jgi:hypothetical protein
LGAGVRLSFKKMDDWFSMIAAGSTLPVEAVRKLVSDGFAVIPGPVPPQGLERLAEAYDNAVIEADAEDVRVGSATTRVTDFVNRGAEFDPLYVYPPVLEACCHIIGQPFKLSSFHARTLRPLSKEQGLHVDFAQTDAGWPMVGFIFMIDEFRKENGATCFVPGSQGARTLPTDIADSEEHLVPACGPAGSVLVFNGSVWHGHGTNETGQPRRSIQGAYIRRDARSAMDWPSRMKADTRERIGPLAKYLMGV